MPARTTSLELPFTARGHDGSVVVSLSENRDPDGLGSDPQALGFPVCRATVEFALDGYLGLVGWVQLAGTFASATNSERSFEIDPLQVFEDVDMPFAFFGLRPQLFDAPSRRDLTRDLDWLAHSFLCVAPTGPMVKEVQAVLGFSWGFRIVRGRVEITRPRELDARDWRAHLPLLRRRYPTWAFHGSDSW